MNILLRSASVLALASAALAASAQTVVNGGFETGDFSGWTVTYAPFSSLLDVDRVDPHTGTYAAFFGASASANDAISQSIATIVGQSYTVSYYLRAYKGPNGSYTGTNGPFTATFGGASVTTPASPVGLYQLHTLTYTATSAMTTLRFEGRTSTGYYDLDDISIVANPTPEPATMAALGLGAVAMLRRRKRA